jgi:uncharacterized protein YndB with AHSA1/START domain
MTNKDTLEVTKTILIPTPVSQVWRFLMNEEKMKVWLNADEFVIDMEDGGKIEFPLAFGQQKYLIIGEISILLLEKKYTFIWRERDSFGDEWFNCTTVSFDLEENENGTLFKLVHNGFKYLPPEVQHQIHKRYEDFWVRGDILDRFVSLVVAE